MTLTIFGSTVTSDRSPHAARRIAGRDGCWEVSWLPGSYLTRDQAVTAMTLADATAGRDVRPGDRLWPHVTGWAAELGITAPGALHHTAGPPSWTRHQDKTTEPPAPDEPRAEGPYWYLTDQSWRDNPVFEFVRDEEPDWAWDEGLVGGWREQWDDPDAPRRPLAPGEGPAYVINLVVSDWYKEPYPDKSTNLRAGHDPQPVPEADKQPDWEAGQ